SETLPGVPLIRAGAIHPVVAFLERLGLRVDRLLARVHLTRDAIADADALVPNMACYAFLEQAAAETGMDDLGFRVGEAGPVVPRIGWFGRRVASAPTLRQAAAVAYRLHPAHNSGERIWMHEAEGRVAFCHRFIVGGASRWPQTVALL